MQKLIGYKAGSVMLLASASLLALSGLQTSQAQQYAEPKAGSYPCYASADSCLDSNAQYTFHLELLDGQRYKFGRDQRALGATYRIKAIGQANSPLGKLFTKGGQITFLNVSGSPVMVGSYGTARNGKSYLMLRLVKKKAYLRCGEGNPLEGLEAAARPLTQDDSSGSGEVTRQSKVPKTSSPSKNTAPARTEAKRAGPAVEGIYLIREYRMQSSGTEFTPTVRYEPYLLLKDGIVYKGVPLVPLEDWDVAKSRAAEPKEWGRWERQRGGGLVLRWGNGSRSEYNRDQCLRAEPAKAGARLNGVYSASSVTESRATGGTSQLAAWSELRFFRDGRFQEGRGSSFSDSAAGGGGLITGGKGGRSGTYTLSGYTLTRKYGDGKVARSLFYRPTDNSIYLGATLYRWERAAP